MAWKQLKRLFFLLTALSLGGIIAVGDTGTAAEPDAPASIVPTLPDVPERSPLKGDNVHLSAVLAPGKPPLTSGLSWKIFKESETDGDKNDAEQELIWSGGGAMPEMTLKPGQYLAEASYGLVVKSQPFEVIFGERVKPVISLDAATLHVHAVATEGGPKLDDMFFTLLEDGEGDAADLSRSSQSEATFHVPAGAYRLIAQHGQASAEDRVTALAGETRTIEMIMETGDVTLSAHALEDGGPLTGATFFVFENGNAGQNREIIRSRLGEPTFSLPAGHYRIAVALGLARAEADLTIKAGDLKHEHLVLNGGSLHLESALEKKDTPLDSNVLYRIYRLGSNRDVAPQGEIFRSTVPAPTLFLPRGRYRVESQYGWHNSRQTREVEIKPGNLETVNFIHQASNVTLRLVKKNGGPALGPVKWTLKFNGSGTVLISQDAEPKLILQSGDYQAVAQHGTKTYTQIFQAASNKDQIVEVIVK